MTPTMQAIVKTEAAPGATYQPLCGTDLQIYNWTNWAAGRIKPPLIFGHEFAGEVVEVGAQVDRLQVGDHVACECHIPCQQCYQCRTGSMHICQNLEVVGVDRAGGFAEYVALPQISAVKTDASMPWEIATLQDPFGNAVHTVSQANVVGKRVAIFGDGPIGVFATAVARAFGASKIFAIGIQPYRMELMKKYHPDVMIDARTEDPVDVILQGTDGVGADVVLEMSGAEPAIHYCFQAVRKGGTMMVFGLPGKPIAIDFANELIFKEVQLRPIFGRRMFETWVKAQNLLLSGQVDLKPVITHTMPMSQIDDVMALLTGDEAKAGKIVLTP
jgi:threonine 3-dehydrogenase